MKEYKVLPEGIMHIAIVRLLVKHISDEQSFDTRSLILSVQL